MASQAEMESLFFLGDLQDADEAPRLSDSLERQGRRMGGLREHRRAVFATGLALAAAAACLAMAMWPAPSAGPRGALVTAAQGKVQQDAPIDAFGQCGGQKWTNGTCCKRGCACVAESKYYSGCHTPSGLSNCNFDRAKTEEEAAAERVQDRKDDLDRQKLVLKAAAKALQDAQHDLQTARHDFMEATRDAQLKDDALEQEERTEGQTMHASIHAAEQELSKLTKETNDDLASKTTKETAVRDKKLKDAKDAHDAAQAAAEQARSEFNAANKAAADKTAEREKVKESVDKYDEEEKVRKDKECGELFGTCTASNCCVLGCQPYWENKYFCMCQGPNKAQYCAWKDAVAKYNTETKQMPTLNEDYHRLMKGNESAATKWERADRHFKEVASKAASDSKAAREEFAEKTKGPADAAEKKLSEAKQKADRKIQAAKDLMKEKTAKARSAAKQAHDVKDSKMGVAKAKHNIEVVAARDHSTAEKEVSQAELALASARAAVKSWHRTANGNTCGEDSDAVGMA
mmetsp:Transcript_107416/g.321221  ORF Transcript_107416/g.321221 Transcript_107416/m.321221 type:complete len:518 (-) Transcript_107416:71-1624(-)